MGGGEGRRGDDAGEDAAAMLEGREVRKDGKSSRECTIKNFQRRAKCSICRDVSFLLVCIETLPLKLHATFRNAGEYEVRICAGIAETRSWPLSGKNTLPVLPNSL